MKNDEDLVAKFVVIEFNQICDDRLKTRNTYKGD
jgi:hypothetical protein